MQLQEEAPLSRLQIDGRGCRIHRNTQEYENIEQMKVMVPWNGDQDCLIDRFDARSMLDFYRDSTVKSKKSDEELEMEEVRHMQCPSSVMWTHEPMHILCASVPTMPICSVWLLRRSETSSNFCGKG